MWKALQAMARRISLGRICLLREFHFPIGTNRSVPRTPLFATNAWGLPLCTNRKTLQQATFASVPDTKLAGQRVRLSNFPGPRQPRVYLC